jgi:hypothetical protein
LNSLCDDGKNAAFRVIAIQFLGQLRSTIPPILESLKERFNAGHFRKKKKKRKKEEEGPNHRPRGLGSPVDLCRPINISL